jgi:HEAT repeat protein
VGDRLADALPAFRHRPPSNPSNRGRRAGSATATRAARRTARKLSDNVRKLQSTDADERLEAITGLGEMNDPKATDYLVASASDPDPRIRIKAIDMLGRPRRRKPRRF